MKDDYDSKMPATLEPEQQMKFIAATSKDSYPPYDAKVFWRDEDGAHEKKKTIYR